MTMQELTSTVRELKELKTMLSDMTAELAKALSGKAHKDALSRIEALARQMKAGCELILQEIEAPKLSDLLSERELEVALLVGKGFPNMEIAEKLHIKDSTVRAHLTRVYKKTGVESRSGLRKILNRG